MKKVNCKNCKWNGGWFSNSLTYDGRKGWQWCEYFIKNTRRKLFKSKFTGIVEEKEPAIIRVVRKAKLNSEGECPHYKRKWWKFWIKEKQVEVGEKVYCGLVYAGEDIDEYKRIINKKYGKKAELRNLNYDCIHGHRAKLYATQDIFNKDFGKKPKLIS